MITLDETKEFLRVSFNDDDKLITMLIAAAVEYIESAVGKAFNHNSERAKLLALVVVKEFYDNREITEKTSNNTRRLIQDFMLQLRLETK
ncbi:MAG: head-tail connector protein [Clostridia bacterium]